MNCPHCADTLMRAKAIDTVSVLVCEGCSGVVVAQNKLVPLLTTLSKSLRDVIDIETPLEPLPQAHISRTCPDCAQPMTTLAYMGTSLVQADRCSSCWHVSATADELGLMAALFLRTQKRTDRRQRQLDDMAEGMARSTHMTLAGGRVADRLASAMIVGGLR
ncbi:MAG: Zn-finger nucleic acid-binding protein [Kiritimatiellia bacterium]|jgi:Zn-finger nucleic acid-binding protein